MITYCIPDVHGRLDLLQKAFFRIGHHFGQSGQNDFRIITLGDYIDRGPDSKGTIEFLMDYQSRYPGSIVCLAGNHDLWLYDLCHDDSEESREEWFYRCGGNRTLASYGNRHGEADFSVVPKEHLDWIHSLPLSHESEHHVFVHATVVDDVPLQDQSEMNLTWALYPKNHPGGWNGKHVVHGHEGIPNGPMLHENRTNLDTRAYKTGRLCVGVFDGPGGPKEILEIKGTA